MSAEMTSTEIWMRNAMIARSTITPVTGAMIQTVQDVPPLISCQAMISRLVRPSCLTVKQIQHFSLLG